MEYNNNETVTMQLSRYDELVKDLEHYKSEYNRRQCDIHANLVSAGNIAIYRNSFKSGDQFEAEVRDVVNGKTYKVTATIEEINS